jgi:hypothetical protein
MLGMKEQAKLAIPILRKALDLSDSDPEVAMRIVESQVSALPTEGDHFERPSEARSGKSSLNENVKSKMKELRRLNAAGGFDPRQAPADILKSYEQLVSEL